MRPHDSTMIRSFLGQQVRCALLPVTSHSTMNVFHVPEAGDRCRNSFIRTQSDNGSPLTNVPFVRLCCPKGPADVYVLCFLSCSLCCVSVPFFKRRMLHFGQETFYLFYPYRDFLRNDEYFQESSQ